MSHSDLFRVALRAMHEDGDIEKKAYSDLNRIFNDAIGEAMEDGKATANARHFTKPEDLRMFCINMAVNSKPIHIDEESKGMQAHELIIRDAQAYYDFVMQGQKQADDTDVAESTAARNGGKRA